MLLLLLGLVALGGVSSQSLMDLSTILISIYLIKDLFNKKITLKAFKPIGIEWAFLGYFVVAVISLAVNGKPPVPWNFYLTKFTWVLNLYVLIYAFNRVEFDLKKWFYFFSIAFLLPNIYALLTFLTSYDFLTHKNIVGAVGLVNSATYHAHGNSLIFVFFASLFIFTFNHFSKKQNVIFATALVLMGLSVFVTYTRGIWGACFISLLILAFWKNKKWGFAFLLATLMSVSTLYIASDSFKLRLSQSFSSESDQMRSNLLKVHYEMFKEHPAIGIGFFESYRQISDYWPKIGLSSDYMESHAHNQYMNVLATTGLIGFFFYMSIIGFFVVYTFKTIHIAKNQSHRLLQIISISVFIVLIQFLLACLTDVTFEYAKIRGILVVALALIVSVRQKLTSGQSYE